MEINLRNMTKEEKNYAYRQSQQLAMQSGYIGSFVTNGDNNSWSSFKTQLDTKDFQEELETMTNIFSAYVLSDPQSYCDKRPDGEFSDHNGTAFGFRADTDKYAYLLRVDPENSEKPLTIFCHKSKLLDKHIENAKRGIRFSYLQSSQDKFHLEDGGKIRLTMGYDGEQKEYTCRYIDPTHLEVGTGGMANLYHIDEFATKNERVGNTYEPIPKEKPSITKQLSKTKMDQPTIPKDKTKKPPDKEVR